MKKGKRERAKVMPIKMNPRVSLTGSQVSWVIKALYNDKGDFLLNESTN